MYAVRAFNTRSIVHEGSVFVFASDVQDALVVAISWVHNNDIYCDPRVDPIVEIVSCELTGEQRTGPVQVKEGLRAFVS